MLKFDQKKLYEILKAKNIDLVESEFQGYLSRFSLGETIHTGRGVNIYRISRAILILIFILIRRPFVVVYDHRNIIGIILLYFKYSKISISEDGLHTLVVDSEGPKYLYRNCRRIKYWMMKGVESRILAAPRFELLPRVVEKLEELKKSHNVSEGSIFIDQPLIDKIIDYGSLLEVIASNTCAYVAKHPRGKKFNYLTFESNRIVELGDLDKSLLQYKSFIGVYSTVLYFAAKIGLEVRLVDLSSFTLRNDMDPLEYEYILSCQRVIINHAEVKIGIINASSL